MGCWKEGQSINLISFFPDGSVLVLDCEPIVEQHGDSVVIRQLAQQVGYAPIFNWLNFLSSLLDLTAQGPLPLSNHI